MSCSSAASASMWHSNTRAAARTTYNSDQVRRQRMEEEREEWERKKREKAEDKAIAEAVEDIAQRLQLLDVQDTTKRTDKASELKMLFFKISMTKEMVDGRQRRQPTGSQRELEMDVIALHHFEEDLMERLKAANVIDDVEVGILESLARDGGVPPRADNTNENIGKMLRRKVGVRRIEVQAVVNLAMNRTFTADSRVTAKMVSEFIEGPAAEPWDEGDITEAQGLLKESRESIETAARLSKGWLAGTDVLMRELLEQWKLSGESEEMGRLVSQLTEMMNEIRDVEGDLKLWQIGDCWDGFFVKRGESHEWIEIQDDKRVQEGTRKVLIQMQETLDRRARKGLILGGGYLEENSFTCRSCDKSFSGFQWPARASHHICSERFKCPGFSCEQSFLTPARRLDHVDFCHPKNVTALEAYFKAKWAEGRSRLTYPAPTRRHLRGNASPVPTLDPLRGQPDTVARQPLSTKVDRWLEGVGFGKVRCFRPEP